MPAPSSVLRGLLLSLGVVAAFTIAACGDDGGGGNGDPIDAAPPDDGMEPGDAGVDAGVDAEVAPVNRPPAFTSTAVTTATAGQVYTYGATAVDPDGDPVTYRVISSRPIAVDALSGEVTWFPWAADVGNHAVTLIASDPAGAEAEQAFSIDVVRGNAPPVITSTPVLTARVGQPYSYPATAVDPDSDALTWSLPTAPMGMTISAAGVVSWTPAAGDVGPHPVVIRAQDPMGGAGQQSFTMGVAASAAGVAPTVSLTAPAALAEVSGPVAVVGTARDADNDLLAYFLELCDANGASCVPAAEGSQPVMAGALGTVDTTGVDNGLATIRLRAVDLAGHSATTTVRVNLTGGLKLGFVEMSMIDLHVDAPGPDLEIVRTYSSLRRGDRLSFGFGWQLDTSEGFRVERSRPESTGWDATLQQLSVIVNEVGDPHYTLVHLPSRKPYAFAFWPQMSLGGLGYFAVNPTYPDVLDTGATLTPVIPADQWIYLRGDDLIANFDLEPFDPSGYELRTADNWRYRIDRAAGLQYQQDPNGNAVTISAGAISHSNGRSITIQRDAMGRITRVADPAGVAVTYAYDPLGNLSLVTRADGTTERYSYAHGHLLTDVVGPGGRLLSHKEYDADGRLIREIDGGGRTRERSYDDAGRKMSIFGASGDETELEYDDKGRVTAAVDPLGGRTTMQYDGEGRLVSRTDPVGGVTTFTHDARGNVLTVTAPHGAGEPAAQFRTTYTYDAGNRVTSVTLPSGARMTSAYDGAGNLSALRDTTNRTWFGQTYGPGGQVTSRTELTGTTMYTVAANGDVTASTDPTGRMTTMTYDGAGRLASYTADGRTATFMNDGFGRTTRADFGGGLTSMFQYGGGDEWTASDSSAIGHVEREYGPDGALVRERAADGSELHYLYDADGRLAGNVDALGRTTRIVHDAAGRPTTTTFPDGATVARTYDAAGRVLTETDPMGRMSTFEYGADGQVSRWTAPGGGVWRVARTPTSTTTTDPLGGATVETRTAEGVVSEIRYPDGATRRFTFRGKVPLEDSTSYPATVTDEEGHVRTSTYDAAGRTTSVTDLAGAAYTYAWTGRTMTSITAPGGAGRVDFGYDDRGRVSSVAWGDGGVTRYVNDVGGQPTQATLPDGSTVAFAYDLAGRPATRTPSAGDPASFEYDAMGNLTRVASGAETVRYAYDARDRLAARATMAGDRIAWQYDLAGSPTTVEVRAPDGTSQRTEYRHDAAGRLAAVIDPLGGMTTFEYDAAGRRTRRTLPNGVVTTYSYDARGRLVDVVHARGATIASSQVTRLGLGAPSRETREDGTRLDITYDGAARVASETLHDGGGAVTRSIAYTYDAAGARATRSENGNTGTYQNAAGFRLSAITGAGAATFTYDANGRTTGSARAGDDWTYSYDVLGRLTSATEGATTLRYAYDGEGRRVASTGGTTGARRFVLGPVRGDGRATTHMVAGANGAPVAGWVFTGDGLPLMRVQNGQPVYYLEDALGSCAAQVDGSGAVVASYRYDGFGNLLAATGPQAGGPAGAGGDFLWRGAWREADTGLYHLRAREYEPVTGRFLTRDPVTPDVDHPESLNPYLYGFSNPYLYSDPTGMFTMVEVGISLDIQDVLQVMKTFAVQQVKEAIREKLMESLANFAFSYLAPFIPVNFTSIFDGNTPFDYGVSFEKLFVDTFCAATSNMIDFVWFQSRHENDGDVLFPGYRCGDEGDLDSMPGAYWAKPSADYIVSGPTPGQGKAITIGDFKFSVSALIAKFGSNQWSAITGFARKHNILPVVVYITYWGGTSAQVKQMQEEALSKRVLLIVFSVMDR